MPDCMCLGNHDMGYEKADNTYGCNIGVNRTTQFNTYFPREKFAKQRKPVLTSRGPGNFALCDTRWRFIRDLFG